MAPPVAANKDQTHVPDQVHDLRASLKQLDRRDWGLWFTAITILLLLCFALISVAAPSIAPEETWLMQDRIAIGLRGLLGLVLLFSVFAIYQQYLIKGLRTKLQEQIAVVIALHGRAEMFERLSILDPLTGLFNRRFAYEHIPREIARAERSGQSLLVMMIDLDGFKNINDTHGHAAGDAALIAFARHLKRAIRGGDLPVRMGGDEFMVVLPGCTTEQIGGLLERICGCQLEVGRERITIKFSVGVAQRQPGEAVADFLQRADADMYERKRRATRQDSLGPPPC